MARKWEKDPGDIEDFSIIWRGSDPTVEYLLEAGESITASVWTVPTGLVEESDSFDATTTTVFISGGVDDTEYEVVNVVTIDSGRTLSRRAILKVTNKYVTST